MISGMVIFSTDEYKLGNIVEMKTGGDTLYGVIEEVNMKNVILRSFDMRKIVIPNANFLKQAIRTYRPDEDFLRIEIPAVVDVNLDINAVLQQTLNQMNAYAFILKKEYNQVLVDSFDDKHVKLKVTFFYNPSA
jgi:small-conductance mechanosensitive channel